MLLILLGIVVAVLPGHRGWFDVGVYHGAVNHWVHEGGQIYDYVRVESTYGFTYPPFAVLVMLPMAAIPWRAMIAISGLMTLVAGVFLVWVLGGEHLRRMGLPRVYGLGMALFLFGALGPVRDTILFGQINLLLVALVYLDLLLLNNPRLHRFAGVGSVSPPPPGSRRASSSSICCSAGAGGPRSSPPRPASAPPPWPRSSRPTRPGPTSPS